MSDAQSQVLRISELQDVIFSSLDKQSQARCARVSKAWTESSLSHLWKELDCVFPLLQLLGNFKSEGAKRTLVFAQARWSNSRPILPSILSFSAPPTAQHWSRFEAYSSLVTAIQVTTFPSYNLRPFFTRENPVYFDAILIEMISRCQKYPHLLPKLSSLRLRWTVYDGDSILPLASALLGPLTSIELVVDIGPYLPTGSTTPMTTFLNDVMAQSPGLECFSLKVLPGADSRWHGSTANDSCHSELDKVIREFLSGQAGSLTTLRVNSTILTTELLELVSKFPQLRALENSGRRLYFTPKPLCISPKSLDGTFPRLERLYLPASARSLATDIVNLGPVLKTITSLTIGCRDYVSPEACSEIFAAISESCSLLTSLEIIACTSSNIVGGGLNSGGAWASERPTPEHRERRCRCLSLQPIFALEYLSRLTVMIDFVLLIDDLVLRELLKNRKTPFDALQLSWTPRRLNLDPPRLTLNALNIVAEYCPRIRILSLFLNVGPTFEWTSPSHSFACLDEMNFGLSTIETHLIAKTAEKLHKLFHRNVPEISASLHTGNFEKCQFEPQQTRKVEENHRRWVEVMGAFNVKRGNQGGKSLRKFARSEGRVQGPYGH